MELRHRLPVIVVGGIASLTVLGFAGTHWLNADRNVAAEKSLSQPEAIQVYFNGNQSRGAEFRDPDRGFRRHGDDFEAIVLTQIQQAETEILLAVQELRLPRVAEALVAKQEAGLTVRVVLENEYHQTIQDAVNTDALTGESGARLGSYFAYQDQNQDGVISEAESDTRDAIAILRRGNVPIVDDTEDGSKGSGLMHHKFMVVDQKTVLVSSTNFTPSGFYGDFDDPDSRGNANNIVVLESKTLAQTFTTEFNFLWGDGPRGETSSRFGINKPQRPPTVTTVGDTEVTVKFSPDSQRTDYNQTSNGLIARFLGQAQDQINLALFVFSEQALADTLDQRFQAGVSVKALIDRGFAFRSFSEGLDLLGVTRLQDCEAETNNNPWALPTEFVGVPALPRGDKLHHKLGIIDDNIVITGSHNWSQSANISNDETLLVLDNPVIAAHYQREFDHLAAISDYGPPPAVATDIRTQARECAVTPRTPTPLATATPNQLVNLNTADQTALESLPGIGPSLAQQIIEGRPYRNLEDLERVNGIGAKTVERLKGKVSW